MEKKAGPAGKGSQGIRIKGRFVEEEKQAVYGVAGDPDDLGYVFRYSEKSGLENLGRVTVDNWQYGNSNSSSYYSNSRRSNFNLYRNSF